MGVELKKRIARRDGVIEDIDLTKRILKETAKARRFPASLDADKLRALIYPDESNLEGMREKIRYHIMLARDNGFIFGGEHEVHKGLRAYKVRPVDGLTSLGLTYLGYSESKGIWSKALEAFGSATVKVTSQELIKVLMKIGVKQMSNLPG